MTMPLEFRKPLVPIAAAVFLAATTLPSYSALDGNRHQQPDLAQSGSSGLFDPAPGPVNSDPLIQLAFSAGATAAIARPLNGAVSECRAVGAEYAASCAAAAFKKAARAASRPDYRDARRELNNAAKKLERLVAQNEDKSAPKKRGKNGSYKAVKQAAVAAVKREAVKIIQETETKLLRSSGSGTRKVHYQKIAQAVGSTKVIFRS